ncbi:MAG: hypothetical protein AB7I18_12285 [Candidatus Berkiella sp.]
MFGNEYVQMAASISVGRTATLILMSLGITMLVHGTYYRAKTQQIVGGALTLLPSTFHYSLSTLFALTSSAQALDIIAYMPLLSVEKWQETQDVMLKIMKMLGYLAIGAALWGFFANTNNERRHFQQRDCVVLTLVGFVFIYFIEISQIVSQVVTR